MAEMRTFHESEHPWDENVPGGVMERTGGRARRKILGDPADGLFVTLGEYDPGIVVAPHSHNQPELMYILEGEVKVGGEPCRAGSVLRIPANTAYGPLESGPRGVRFLVIRPGATNTAIVE